MYHFIGLLSAHLKDETFTNVDKQQRAIFWWDVELARVRAQYNIECYTKLENFLEKRPCFRNNC